jgi:hypothetical protein
MKKSSLIILALVILGSVSNCALSGFGPIGGLFTDHKIGVFATGTEGSKKGNACATSILGLVAYGDASVEEAARKSNISKISNINLHSFSVLGVYGTLCTHVQGD